MSETVEVLLPFADAAPSSESPVSASGFLRGGRCDACRGESFPQAFVCPACNSTQISSEEISGRGSLYSFTTVHISPTFQTPYSLGYVDLVSGLRVLGQILVPHEDLRCELPVRAVENENSPTGWGFIADEGEDR